MVIIHIVEPFAAGVATYIKSLTENMTDNTHIIIHGERNNLTAAAEVKKYFPKNNVKFIRWSNVQRELNFKKDFNALVKLIRILKRFKTADAVHLHSSKAGFLGRIACSILGIENVIYTPNGASFLIDDLSDFKVALYKRLEQFASLFGGRVICTSKSERRAYVDIGIKASYINNGTSILTTEEIKTVKNLNSFRIITAGRIVSQKGPKMFNELAEKFKELKNFEFVWIGDGQDKDLLTSDNIRVTGWLTTEQVHQEIKNSDLYLSTSKYEGLPLAVLEAMNLKKCLLLSDCVGNRDLVRSGKNGELFNTVDDAEKKILNLYAYRESIRSMGEYSYELCFHYFNAEKMASSYNDEYRQGPKPKKKKVAKRARVRTTKSRMKQILSVRLW
jgi:glycosyltransferase involved in cell wall biosynthesis